MQYLSPEGWRPRTTRGLFVTCLALAAAVIILVALLVQQPTSSCNAAEGTSSSSATVPYEYGTTGTAVSNVKPLPDTVRGAKSEQDFKELASRTTTASQMTIVNLAEHSHEGTANERTPRPALSLAKLYLAQYIVESGSTDERFEAMDMISTSDDELASKFDSEYPEAIDTIAKKYSLESTSRGSFWGYSVTSMYDVAIFVARLLEQDPMNPVLLAMSQTSATAADGYDQSFGTATLDGAIGSKLGWSDERDLHSSVSFGKGWVAAAAIAGSARDLTQLVDIQMADRVATIEGNPAAKLPETSSVLSEGSSAEETVSTLQSLVGDTSAAACEQAEALLQRTGLSLSSAQ